MSRGLDTGRHTYGKGKVVALVLNSPFADLIVGIFNRVNIPMERSTSPVKPDDEMCQAVETRASVKNVSQDTDEGIWDKCVVQNIVWNSVETKKYREERRMVDVISLKKRNDV